MSSDAVLYQEHKGVVRLTINRPEQRNALGAEVHQGLLNGLLEAQSTPHVQAIVITGAGEQAFCAGGNLKSDAKTFTRDYAIPGSAFAHLLNAALECTVPMIARVNGHCLAGGMGILAMCDLAVASSGARFGLPEVRIGLFPMQVNALLQRLISPRKLAELSITGEPIDAQEALDIGLINYHVPAQELDVKIDWLLARIVDKSPTAIRRGKYAMRAIADMTTRQSIDYMANELGTLSLTRDAQEGLLAFNEKRKPVWSGR